MYLNTGRFIKSAIQAIQRALNKEELFLRKLLVYNLVPRGDCFYKPVSVKKAIITKYLSLVL